jgi:hypothetical protein
VLEFLSHNSTGTALPSSVIDGLDKAKLGLWIALICINIFLFLAGGCILCIQGCYGTELSRKNDALRMKLVNIVTSSASGLGPNFVFNTLKGSTTAMSGIASILVFSSTPSAIAANPSIMPNAGMYGGFYIAIAVLNLASACCIGVATASGTTISDLQDKVNTKATDSQIITDSISDSTKAKTQSKLVDFGWIIHQFF